MKVFQQTIKSEKSISGVGFFTNTQTKLTFKPAPINSGITFFRTDTKDKTPIEALVDNVSDTKHGIKLEKNSLEVYDVTTLLGAVSGLEIDNLVVEIDSPEIPFFDSSAFLITETLLEAQILEQKEVKKYFEPTVLITNEIPEKRIETILIPSEHIEITTLIDFNSPVLGTQFATLNDINNFQGDISSCRRFVFFSELQFLINKFSLKNNLAKELLVIVDKPVTYAELEDMEKHFCQKLEVTYDGFLNSAQLRYTNECARNVVLRFMGAMSLLGNPIKGKLIAKRPTNFSNVEFVKKLKNHMSANKSSGYEYDIALSFAGEDREYVEEVAKSLKKGGVNVFYDMYEKENLWGKDLYKHLSNIYQNKCKYCVVFISQHYAKKLWTNHELKNVQARAFRENEEYLLPARFDDTPLDGVTLTTGYIDLNKTSSSELSNLIIAKLKMSTK